jgi:hypothetical protein
MADQTGRRKVTILPNGVRNRKALARPIIAASTTYPIRLPAKAPFVSGVAALVFVSPHVLDASQDHAEFGTRIHHPEALDIDEKCEFIAPHQDRRLVAWFRATDSNQSYLVEFTCIGIGSFTLVDGEGGSEVEQPDPADRDNWGVSTARLLRTFKGGPDWRWFSLANDSWWKLTGCEIRQL